MSEFKRSGLVGVITSNLDTIAAVIKLIVPISITSAVMGWATWFTGLFQPYAPASWIFAAIAGGLMALVGMALYAYARERLQRVRFRAIVMNTTNVNPLEALFTLKRIKLVDLAPPIGGIVEGKTFVKCDLIGPANLVFEGCQFF